MSRINQVLLIIIAGLIITSCTSILPNKETQKGIDRVAAFFGGTCTIGKDIHYSTEDGKKVTAQIEISNSEVVEHFANRPGLCASNAAYLFYDSLMDEKKNINSIQVTLHYKDGSSTTNEYKKAQLDTVVNNMSTVNMAIQLLKVHNYEGVYDMLTKDTSTLKINKEPFISSIKAGDSAFGDIKGFRLYGYQVTTTKNGRVIFYAGVLSREKQNSKFAIGVIPGNKSRPVTYLDYSF
jgi:hypothetical protein